MFGLAVLCVAAFLSPPSRGSNVEVLTTRHYRIYSDVGAELTSDLGRRMDAMYDEYVRRLAVFRNDAAAPPLDVYLFRRQQDYLRFTGDRWKNSGGVFMSGKNLVAAFLEGQGRDALRRTLQHEAFHQFAHRYISPDMPVWLNEGMAQLFEEGIWTGETFMLGEVPPRRVRQLNSDLREGRIVRFEEMLAVQPDAWSDVLAGDHARGATQYNQSWAMVHFLVQAKSPDGKERYRGRLVDMLRGLHGGKGGREAFEAAFSANVAGFQTRFTEYAKTLAPTPTATLIERQEVLADFMTELKSHGMEFQNVRDFRETAVRAKFVMHYTERGLSWSTEPNVGVYFSDTAGRLFNADELLFSTRAGGPLPDVVCRASPRLLLRTRFHAAGDKVEHEVLVEMPERQARLD